jgi:tetratricopeptide (TPR) repeat protein
LLLGDITKRNGRYTESERYYKMAIFLMPDNPKPYNNLAGLYMKLERCNEAVTYYRKAYEIGDNYLLPLYNLGVIYYKELKDKGKAEYYWNKFLKESKPEELSVRFRDEREKVKKILKTLN